MKISFLSAHSMNSIPMLVGLMRELGTSFRVFAYHIRVKEYAQLPSSVTERPFRTLQNRKEILGRSRLFNLRRYVYLNYHILKQVLAGNQVIYCTDDTVMLMVLLYCKFFGKKKNTVIVYHEFENVDKKNKLTTRIEQGMKLNTNLIDLVIAPEPNRLMFLLNNLRLTAGKGMMVPNTCDAPDENTNVHPAFQNIPGDSVKLLHVGSIGAEGHYFEELLRALPLSWTLILVGTVSDGQMELVTKYKQQKQIVLISQVPHKELASIYRGADLGLILYKGVDFNHEYCAPNKLYEFWSFGLPVIAHSLKGLQSVFVHPFQGKLFDFTGAGLQEELTSWAKTVNLQADSTELRSFFKDHLLISTYADDLKEVLTNYLKRNEKSLSDSRYTARTY
ncbi:MAG TPA: glycosyltransferase [Chitinophagaceae bacterium]